MTESSQAFRRYRDKNTKPAKIRGLTPKETNLEKEKRIIDEILQRSDNKIKKIKGRKSSQGPMGSLEDPLSPDLPKEQKSKAPRLFSPNIITLSLNEDGEKVASCLFL
jgi:hypothetical protein